jgi:molecular chaperone GrpE
MVEENNDEVDKSVESSESLSEEEAQAKLLIETMMNSLNENQAPAVDNKESEYLDRIARLGAEFDNFRRRTEKERHENLINANFSLISELVPVIDNFELSLKHNKDAGVMLIFQEFKKILEKQGLKVIDTSKKFDPKFHEAVLWAEGKEDGLILEEIQKGYMLNDKLLRASKVKISKVGKK